VTSSRWRNFDHEQIQALARGPRFRDAPGERVCPACGATTVRTYFQGGERLGNPILMTYTWCANCHRYSGATGPKPTGLEFDDPLERVPPPERSELGQDLVRLLTYLDQLWDEGVLPQRISTR
jgi:CTP:molybdopterin cytidylyltransferase MocA